MTHTPLKVNRYFLCLILCCFSPLTALFPCICANHSFLLEKDEHRREWRLIHGQKVMDTEVKRLALLTIEESVCNKITTLKLESDLEEKKRRAHRNARLRPAETPEFREERRLAHVTPLTETIRERFKRLPSAKKDLKHVVEAAKTSAEKLLSPAQLEKKKKKEEDSRARKEKNAIEKGKEGKPSKSRSKSRSRPPPAEDNSEKKSLSSEDTKKKASSSEDTEAKKKDKKSKKSKKKKEVLEDSEGVISSDEDHDQLKAALALIAKQEKKMERRKLLKIAKAKEQKAKKKEQESSDSSSAPENKSSSEDSD